MHGAFAARSRSLEGGNGNRQRLPRRLLVFNSSRKTSRQAVSLSYYAQSPMQAPMSAVPPKALATPAESYALGVAAPDT
jgi:hypothetical protein